MNSPTLRPLTFRPIDDVEASLIASWRGVAQATHRFLVLLREFDLRQGWKPYGNSDCAEWLDWKCGIARVTAQEKVRVAHTLWGLPQIEDAFARGDLSYGKKPISEASPETLAAYKTLVEERLRAATWLCGGEPVYSKVVPGA